MYEQWYSIPESSLNAMAWILVQYEFCPVMTESRALIDPCGTLSLWCSLGKFIELNLFTISVVFLFFVKESRKLMFPDVLKLELHALEYH